MIIRQYSNTQMHRIAVLETGHVLEGQIASGDQWMEKISKHMPKEYAFEIIVPKFNSNHWNQKKPNVHFKYLPKTPFDNNAQAIFLFLAYLLRIIFAVRILKKTYVDIIYSTSHIISDVLPAYFLKKIKPEAIWIAQVHHITPPPSQRTGYYMINIISYLMQQLTFNCLKSLCDAILINNTAQQKKLELIGFPINKLNIVGAGIEFEQISKLSTNPKKIIYDCIFVGRLHYTKGIFDLVPIWKKVLKEKPAAILAVIGDGTDKVKKQLLNQIKLNNLQKNILLLGYKSGTRLFLTMKQARIFLFTDHEAGWGVAVAEAMACGLPVVGYDNGVLGSVYKKGFIKIPFKDYDNFSKQIILLLENRAKRMEVAKQAVNQAAKLDWRNAAKKFNLILESF